MQCTFTKLSYWTDYIIITDNSLELTCNWCCFVIDNRSTTQFHVTIVCGTYKCSIYGLKLCVKSKLYVLCMFCHSRLTCGKGQRFTVVTIEVGLLTILLYYMLWLTDVKRLNFTMALKLLLKIHINYKLFLVQTDFQRRNTNTKCDKRQKTIGKHWGLPGSVYT